MYKLSDAIAIHNGECHPNDVWLDVDGPWMHDINVCVVATSENSKRFTDENPNYKVTVLQCTVCDWEYYSKSKNNIVNRLYMHWHKNHGEYLILMSMLEYSPRVWSNQNNYPVIIFTNDSGWSALQKDGPPYN
jgi:predicted small metal-binding protein